MEAAVFPAIVAQSAAPSVLLAIVACAVLSGVASMLVYRRFSQQERLRELERMTADVRLSLRNHDGAFTDALPLLRQNVALAGCRLKLALLPSLVAGVPIVIALVGLDACVGPQTVLPFGPAWSRSWPVVFLAVSFLAALLTKIALRIR
ncbi:MAG: hypothetical protein DWQ37_00850 [Planctomycetota bacterium]|nr:MAG: hypothetical protein DWQ37_00850 [Planctomycetota bacterium]